MYHTLERGWFRESMSLFLVGVNHRSAPVEFRERFAIPSRDLPAALRTLRRLGLANAAVLSTCNRVEYYLSASDPAGASAELLEFLAHHSRLDPAEFRAHLYQAEGAGVAAHLFRVTAGLDSAILGESEIAAQVKETYRIACEEGTADAALHRLFQRALHAAKEIRSRTGIAQGQASVGAVVAALARRLFAERLASCEVLLWGAGKAAEATARHLIKDGIRRLWIVNRTQFKAQDLASLCQGGWLSWELALQHLARVDIAIVCTQAPHYVIDQGDLDAVASSRGDHPLCLIDLAVPRNVEPSLARRDGVVLYNIDDLQAAAQIHLAAREEARARGETMIRQQVDDFTRRHAAAPHEEVLTC